MLFYQILDQVTDVTAVYQDDFVGCGRTQILCLLPGFSLESSSDWLLTDKGVWLVDQKSTTEECHTEHQPAVFALQKRLQVNLGCRFLILRENIKSQMLNFIIHVVSFHLHLSEKQKPDRYRKLEDLLLTI